MENVIPTEIGRETLRELVKAGAQLVEVPPKEQYKNAPFPFSGSIPDHPTPGRVESIPG